MSDKEKETQLKEAELKKVAGGANDNEIEINVKTLYGDDDDYDVHQKDKISDLISKYKQDKK